MNPVCYLVRAQVSEAGLVFPSELDDPQAAGLGSFFVLGAPGSRLELAYDFPAVHGNRIVRVPLIQDRVSASFFRASVDNVGRFLFHAETVRGELPYLGSDSRFVRSRAVRRLRAWRPGELEKACREHNFYFVGFSPRIDPDALP